MTCCQYCSQAYACVFRAPSSSPVIITQLKFAHLHLTSSFRIYLGESFLQQVYEYKCFERRMHDIKPSPTGVLTSLSNKKDDNGGDTPWRQVWISAFCCLKSAPNIINRLQWLVGLINQVAFNHRVHTYHWLLSISSLGNDITMPYIRLNSAQSSSISVIMITGIQRARGQHGTIALIKLPDKCMGNSNYWAGTSPERSTLRWMDVENLRMFGIPPSNSHRPVWAPSSSYLKRRSCKYL
ncbi:hypothetical protein B0H10DRAFT_106876 [Mycena sp. CBHHK59/15]|nr:hypothetical protein B0H10DRAFT_106876 [Mycena sp. CBHHK59/15]